VFHKTAFVFLTESSYLLTYGTETRSIDVLFLFIPYGHPAGRRKHRFKYAVVKMRLLPQPLSGAEIVPMILPLQHIRRQIVKPPVISFHSALPTHVKQNFI